MKSLVNLASKLLDDLGSCCSVETARDLVTIKSRAQHEGVSFLTITLPDFATDFERSLEQGRVDSTLFTGWRKRGCLPAFLQGFTSLVFGANGEVREDASTSAVFAVRQICRFFKKVRIDCNVKRSDATFKKYRQLEAVLSRDDSLGDSRLEHFAQTCDYIWSTVLGSREGFNTLGLVPRHGPGATAEGISGNAKYLAVNWPERLEEVFPFTEYLFASLNQLECHEHGINAVRMLPEASELPVRIIGVPKTLKGPRIIAIEPVCMQYTQQAVARWTMRQIERSPLVRNAIRFTDQTVNQKMALLASASKSHATIDLSDASDRVTLDMVRVMLRSQPDFLTAVEACRSTSAKLPSGEIIRLKKFASMGSAMCFPIESMYFFSVIVHGRLWKHRLPPDPLHIRRMCKGLHVYGDDIIVPTDETDTVYEALTTFGCKVNATKSFSRGFFRESCGMDAFRGESVTPIYLRERGPRNRRDSVGLLSWISTSNQLHAAGCWKTADYMKYVVEGVLGKLPCILESSPGLGWVSFVGIPSYKVCDKIHTPLVRTYKVITRKERDNLDGYPALLKYFLRTHGSDTALPDSMVNKEHLRFSARCGTVSRKRHWVPAL